MSTENKSIDPVPEQHSGSQMDAVEKREFTSNAKAAELFELACARLLSVSQWSKYAGISDFALIDDQGKMIARNAIKGDYIRIDIPGPGTKAGKGYDWVRIEELINFDNGQQKILSMTVRPCSCPGSTKEKTAHFLKAEATSTFIIRKQGLSVYAEEHGRNEMPNATGGLYDQGRNFVVGMAAKIGFSYPQWKSLVKALLKD